MASPSIDAGESSVTLPPEYQESYLKSLLASIYNPYAGNIVDAEGNIIQEGVMQRPDTLGEGQSWVSAPTGLASTSPLAGIPSPEVAGFTPAQQEAIRLGISNVGSYIPAFQQGYQTMGQGLGFYGEAVDMARLGAGALAGTGAAYDPNSYKNYYDPFVDEVIKTTQADIDRQARMERGRLAAQGVQAGAYGGSRGAIAEQELQRNAMSEQARIGAQLRSQAYGQAQTQAQSAFENQMARNQSAAATFANLGQGIGAMAQGVFQGGVSQMAAGEALQGAGIRDVNALYNLGALEQGQIQSELDTRYQDMITRAYEPYQRLGFMSDIYRGVPTSSSTITAKTSPTPGAASSILGGAQSLSGLQSSGGSLYNPSGS
jgi:hypothetical protein